MLFRGILLVLPLSGKYTNCISNPAMQRRTIMQVDNEELETIIPVEEQCVREGLLATSEGCILVTGIVIALLSITGLALSWLWSPEKSRVLVAMTATNILFGRAVGLSVGFTADLGHSVVVPVNMLIETLLVFLFYPLFVFSWRRLIVIQVLRNLMERTSKAAEAHRETVRRYGMLGLLVFVWSPFWMTGPVVGCAIGFLLGFRPLFNLIVVLAGTYLAITCWAILLKNLQDHVATYSPFAPMIVVAIIILIVVGSYVLHCMKRDNHSRKR